MGEAVGDHRRELALDPGHLGAQRAPGGTLVDLGAGANRPVIGQMQAFGD